MENVKVDYDAIAEKVEGEFLYVMRNFPGPYDGFVFRAADERQFVGSSLKPNGIYAAIHFGPASANFGQSVVPATIEIVSERNSFEAARALASEFVARCSLTSIGGVRQIFQTPTVLDAGAEVGSGFRALLSISATFVVMGDTAVDVKSVTYWDESGAGHDVPFLTYADSYAGDVRPQPLPGGEGFATSTVGFKSFTFSISFYPFEGALWDKLFAMKYGEGSENSDFAFTVEFTDGKSSAKRKYKLSSFQLRKNLADAGAATASFTL